MSFGVEFKSKSNTPLEVVGKATIAMFVGGVVWAAYSSIAAIAILFAWNDVVSLFWAAAPKITYWQAFIGLLAGGIVKSTIK